MSTIADELSQIAEENEGILRPEDVVKFAENPKTALHNKFEWDNKKAGFEYRLIQARHIIVDVKIEYPNNGETQAWISIVSDRKEPGGGYRLILDVMSDKERRKELLVQLKKEIKSLQKKYALFKELAEAFDGLNKAIDEVKNS